MAKIRVLHMVENLPLGGLENVIASIVLRLDNERYEPIVWCLSRGGIVADQLINKGIPLSIHGFSSYHNPINLLRLALLIKDARIDILHTHGYFASTFGRLAGILAGVPIMLTHVHSTYTNYKKKHIMMERFLSRFTDKIICIGRAVQDFVVHYEGIPSDRTIIIFNGVDRPDPLPADFNRNQARTVMGLDPNDVVLIIVASLGPTKGHHDLLHALKYSSDSVKNLKLLIVGDGPLRQELQLTAVNLGVVDRTFFLGERFDVASLRHIADICLLPSVGREGLSLSLLEASALGLPLIGTRLGGISEIIEDNVNGLLVNVGAPRELSDAIVRLSEDPVLRKRMGDAGKRVYENKFSLTEMIHRIQSLYDHLQDEKRRAS